MILFSQKNRLARIYREWLTNYRVNGDRLSDNDFTLISWLQQNGMLNEDKIKEYLNDQTNNKK